MHGVTSPDMKELLITMNESDNKSAKEYGNVTGKMHMAVLDTAELEKGKIKVLRKGTADGNFKSTISFRQYFSPDGKSTCVISPVTTAFDENPRRVRNIFI